MVCTLPRESRNVSTNTPGTLISHLYPGPWYPGSVCLRNISDLFQRPIECDKDWHSVLVVPRTMPDPGFTPHRIDIHPALTTQMHQ
jgi:hypothetical protein